MTAMSARYWTFLNSTSAWLSIARFNWEAEERTRRYITQYIASLRLSIPTLGKPGGNWYATRVTAQWWNYVQPLLSSLPRYLRVLPKDAPSHLCEYAMWLKRNPAPVWSCPGVEGSKA